MRILAIILLSTSACFAQTKQVKSGDVVRLGDKFSITAAVGATTLLYTNYVYSTPRGDWNGLVGQQWTNTQNITVTALGRYVVSTNNPPRLLQLVLWSDKSVIASATLNISNATEFSFSYTNLASPVALSAGIQYALVSEEISGSTSFANNASGSKAVFSTGVYGGAAYSATYSTSGLLFLASDRPFGPLDLKYTTP
jgi:hypothetical protein